MGIRASLAVISAEALHEIEMGGNPALDVATRYALDKSWIDFHTLLNDLGPPLSRTIVGDIQHPECTHSIESLGNEYDYFCGFASVAIVRKISEELDRMGRVGIRRLYDSSETPVYDVDLSYFERLKAAYADAAAGDNGLMVVIA